jgi:hypothetical protein
MSQFYDLASLVVIPSGYKASTIYAQKPLTTDGQLSFTRASGATRVASNGLIEKVRTNLVLQSNDFSSASWTKLNGVTVSPTRVADPFGGTTAWQLVYNGTTDGRLEQNVVGFTGQGTQSVWLRVSTGTQIVKIGAVGGSTVSATVTTTWTRYSATTTGGNFPRIVCDANTTIQAYGCQFEAGDIATNYIPTTTAAVSVGPVSNVPRLDYTNSSCPRLLLEPQRTNLFTFSESFDDSSWTKAGSTITANNATSPDGYSSADRIVETATTATHLILRSVALTAASHTFSCFIKAVSGSTRNVGLLFNTTGKGVIVNPSTGAVVLYSGTTPADVKIETYSNGWYRVAVTATTAAITESLRIYLANGTTWTAPYAGDGTSSALIWGAQLEAGAYATSYIPTLSASVTRVADAASKTGISSLIGQTEGTLYAEFNVGGADGRVMSTLGGSNRFGMTASPTAVGAFIVTAAGGVVYSTSAAFTHGATTKMALAYKSGESVLYVNGSAVLTTTASFAFNAAITDLFLSQQEFAPGAGQSGKSQSQALLFKTRLTNAQLAELTTL